MTTPKAYRRLITALNAGRLGWADRLLADGNGRGESAWSPAVWETPVPADRHRYLDPRIEPIAQQHARQQRHYRAELWEAVRSGPSHRRLAGYALLERHGVGADPDHALSLLWRAADVADEPGFWHARGLCLRAHRPRLLGLLVPLASDQRRSTEDERFFRTPGGLAHAFRAWEREDPQLFSAPERRGQLLRWMHAAPLARTQDLITTLTQRPGAWALENWTAPTTLVIEGIALPMPAGSLLGDHAQHFNRWMTDRAEAWVKFNKGPSPVFWTTLARLEHAWQALLDAGADPHACDAQGRSPHQQLCQGEGGALLIASQRQRTMESQPSSVRRPRPRA